MSGPAIHLDRGVASPDFNQDVTRCRRRGHRQLHEGGRWRLRRFEHRNRYAPRRRFNSALTHPPPDLIRVDAVGHGNAGNRGARLAARFNDRPLECLGMMTPAAHRLLDFHRKCAPSFLRGRDLRGLTRQFTDEFAGRLLTNTPADYISSAFRLSATSSARTASRIACLETGVPAQILSCSSARVSIVSTAKSNQVAYPSGGVGKFAASG